MANLKKVEKDKKKALAIIVKIEQDPAYLTLKQQAEDAQKQANDIRQQMADFMTDAKKKSGYFGLVKKQKSKTTAQRTEPTTTTDIKKDFQNGEHSKYGLVIFGVVYPISKSGQYYHLGGALVMCGKVNGKTEHGVDLDFVKKNGLTTLNKLGIFVFGSATNIYTKLRGV
jgi:chlorite dismutase